MTCCWCDRPPNGGACGLPKRASFSRRHYAILGLTEGVAGGQVQLPLPKLITEHLT